LERDLDAPFESIESAQEYLRLLLATTFEATRDVEIAVSAQTVTGRRLEALRLVLYKLEQFENHIKTSCRILNDLRSLRRLLLDERTEEAPMVEWVNNEDGGA